MSGDPATKPKESAAPAPGRRGGRSPLLRYALRRLAGLVPTLLGVTLLTCALLLAFPFAAHAKNQEGGYKCKNIHQAVPAQKA